MLLLAAFALPVPTRAGEPKPVQDASEGDGVVEQAAAAKTGAPPIEVIVTAPQPPMAVSAARISSEQIERALPTSGSELLARVSGLRIVQHGAEGKGHQIVLRGFDAAHGTDVEVLLEGIALNERGNVHGHGYVDLYGIIPEVVREIHVDKGSFLPTQGDFATAGTVRFELGVPAEARPKLLRTELDSHGRLRTAAVIAPGRVPPDSFAAAEAVYDPGFGLDRAAVRTALLASYSVPLGPRDRLVTLVSAQLARWQSPGVRRLDDAQDFYGTYAPTGRGLSDRVLLRFGRERQTSESRLDVAGFAALRRLAIEDNYTGRLLHEEQGDRRLQTERAASGGCLASVGRDLPLGFAAQALGGAGWRVDGVQPRDDRVTAEGLPWQRGRELEIRTHQIHAYLGLRLRPLRWLELLPSIRGDLFLYRVSEAYEPPAAQALGAASPRAALRLPLATWLQLFAAYGRGLRSPEPRSIAAPPPETIEDESLSQYGGGRPRITTSDTVELGSLLRPLDGLELRVAAFGTWIERELVFDHLSNLNLELDGTRRLGLEASLGARLLPWLELALEGTALSAHFLRSGNPVPGSTPWLGRAALWAGEVSGPHGGLELDLCATRELAHGATASGYGLLDLSAGWRWPRYDLTMAVTNALGAQVMEGVYHYASWFDPSEPRSAIPAIHYTAGRPMTVRLLLTAWL